MVYVKYNSNFLTSTFKFFLNSFIILGVKYSVNMGGKEIDFFNSLGWTLYN